MQPYPKVNTFKDPASFRQHLREIGLFSIDLTDTINPDAFRTPFFFPKEKKRPIGNRWCILPMEGWDCLPDGRPSDLTKRRWMRFATSGAKLLFGCEAAAVMESGRSNTRQLMIHAGTYREIGALLTEMRRTHAARFATADDLWIGLQLNHAGRYSHPHDDRRLESVTAYSHPLLDKKFGNSAANVVSDEAIQTIIAKFVEAARFAKEAGFDFVDVKMAHGYLGFEFLSAFDRPGPYGGSFENRTRFFREIVEGIRREVPDLEIATRLSLFDFVPFQKGPDGVGVPMAKGPYRYAFAGDGTGLGYDLTETYRFLELCEDLGIRMICTSAGSPYYNPHIQRPAYYPVSDGYLPPEEPLIGVARQIEAVNQVKTRFPHLAFIGSAYTALQEYLPHVGGWVLQNSMADFIGIGRMSLSYPEICADVLEGRPLNSRKICRTFGDCTTAPRNGLISGCYPLDEFYKSRPEYEQLKAIKKKVDPLREKEPRS